MTKQQTIQLNERVREWMNSFATRIHSKEITEVINFFFVWFVEFKNNSCGKLQKRQFFSSVIVENESISILFFSVHSNYFPIFTLEKKI